MVRIAVTKYVSHQLTRARASSLLCRSPFRRRQPRMSLHTSVGVAGLNYEDHLETAAAHSPVRFLP